MDARTLLDALCVAERLKDTTRHCYTSNGRQESVAEHSWMMTLMAFFIKDEFPEVDMDKVIKMCIIHDLGEAFTGDIPTFDKTVANEKQWRQKSIILNFSMVFFPLHLVSCYIVLHLVMTSDKGKNTGKKIW